MDSKKKIKKDVELVLLALHEKIDFLQQKIDKLCESSGCFKTSPKTYKKDDK